MRGNDLYYTNYSEWLHQYDEAIRYAEWESIHRPWDGDNRSKLDRKLDSLSLYDAWNYYTAHSLRNRIECDEMLEYEDDNTRAVKARYESKAYEAENPYRNGGEKVFVGDYVYDQYHLMQEYQGWYGSQGYCRLSPVNHGNYANHGMVTLDEAVAIAAKAGRRLFVRSAEGFSEVMKEQAA